jgi:RHS repeat-associated protein
MSSRSLTRAGNTLANEGYTYDPMDRITAVDRESANDDTFTYYLDGELKTASYAGAGAYNGTYNLDKAGNRTSVAYSTGTVTYTPNVINQYTAAENSGLSNGTEHEISAAWGANYTYINDGQLSLVSVPGGASTQLYHDALGRVAKRLVNGTQLRYVVSDGEREILELDSSRAITARNVYGKGIDEILMRADIVSGFTYYYQQDHEGSITHLTSAAGAFLEKYRYDAFGLPTYYNAAGANIGASAYANPYLFTARRKLTWDTYEYRARAYNAELGRFMSEDPMLFDAGDYNLFRYCHNDPLDLTDPMGLETPGQYWMKTNERMWAWEKSMESSIAGERAFTALQTEQMAKSLTMGREILSQGPIRNPNSGSYAKVEWGGETAPMYQSPEEISAGHRGRLAYTTPNLNEPTGRIEPSSGKIEVAQTVTATRYLPYGSVPGTPLYDIETRRVEHFRGATGDASAAAQALAFKGFRDISSGIQAVQKSTRDVFERANMEYQSRVDVIGDYRP